MGTLWAQTYDPLHSPVLSTLVAALPIVVLLGAIAVLRIRIHFSALIGLGTALAVALLVYQMPVKAAAASSLYGAAFGLFPIGWIILNVIFLYQLTVKRGLFDLLRDSLATLAPDPRVQVILIAFSFGAFIEGVSGFGTPVAITGAILIQLGFRPLHASGLALIANTAPVAFGSLGIPITTLEQVTGLDALKISAMVGRQLPFFSVLVPFWVVGAFAGWRGMWGVWPASLVAGVAFAVPQFLVSNFHGPWLVDVTAGACSIAALVGLMRFWRPKDKWAVLPNEGAEEPAPADERSGVSAERRQYPEPQTAVLSRVAATMAGAGTAVAEAPCVVAAPAGRSRGFRGTMPWVILTAFILLWGLPQFKAALDKVAAPKLAVPICTSWSSVCRQWRRPMRNQRRRSSGSISFRPPARASCWRPLSLG
jgi:lactate permease